MADLHILQPFSRQQDLRFQVLNFFVVVAEKNLGRGGVGDRLLHRLHSLIQPQHHIGREGDGNPV